MRTYHRSGAGALRKQTAAPTMEEEVEVHTVDSTEEGSVEVTGGMEPAEVEVDGAVTEAGSGMDEVEVVATTIDAEVCQLLCSTMLLP
jgi:hypothetical protein